MSHEILHRHVGGGTSSLLKISLRSPHGAECPLPWLGSCALRFAHAPELPAVAVSSPAWTAEIEVDQAWLGAPQLTAQLELGYALGTNAEPSTIEYTFEPEPRRRVGRGGARRFDVVTCVVHYDGSGGQGAGAGAAEPAHTAPLEPCSVSGQASTNSSSTSELHVPTSPGGQPPPPPRASPLAAPPPAAPPPGAPLAAPPPKRSSLVATPQEQAPGTPPVDGAGVDGTGAAAPLGGTKRPRSAAE